MAFQFFIIFNKINNPSRGKNFITRDFSKFSKNITNIKDSVLIIKMSFCIDSFFYDDPDSLKRFPFFIIIPNRGPGESVSLLDTRKHHQTRSRAILTTKHISMQYFFVFMLLEGIADPCAELMCRHIPERGTRTTQKS